MPTAEKLPAKYNVFHLRRSQPSPRFDVNSSLQVETCSMFDRPAFSFDLHERDHVTLFDLLISFFFKRSSNRGILPCILDDRVKHVSELALLRRDHVKLRPNLPCSDAITSDFG